MTRQKDGFKGERAIVLPEMVIQTECKDPLVSSLYVTDIGYYPRAYNHYRERREPISENVLIYCVSGEGWYRIGEQTDKGVRYPEATPLKAGEFVILPSGRPHVYGACDDPWTIYWVHFAGEHASIYSKGMQTPQLIKAKINSRLRNRNELFDEIMIALKYSSNIDNLRYASSLLHYYLATMRYLRQYRQAQDAPSLDPIEASIHFMREHIEQHMTLADIAAYVGYSPSHFSALFRQRMNESPLS